MRVQREVLSLAKGCARGNRVPPKKQSSEQRNAGRTLRIAPLKKSNFHKCNNIELIQTMDKWGNNMKIIYYGIDDCEYAMIAGRPALIAAAMVSEEYLKSLDFVQLIDGRWCHFMDEYEYNAYISGRHHFDGINQSPGNVKHYDENDIMITLGLVLLYIIGIILLFYDLAISLFIIAVSLFVLFISALCHNSLAVKTLVTLIIITHIVLTLFVIFVIHSFLSALGDCVDQSSDTSKNKSQIGAQYTYFME